MYEDLGWKKILVIDDEEYLLKLLKSRFMINRFEVVTAFSGKEGLEKARAEKPDLIVLDVLMPEMDGIEFIKIAKRDPDLASIPIIVISAQPDMQKQIKPEDIHAFVAKPFNPDRFIATVKKVLRPSDTSGSPA